MRRMKRLQIMCRCLTSRTSHRVCPCASRRQSKRPVNIEPAVTGFCLSNRPYFGDLVAILVGGMLVSMQVRLRQQLHPSLRIQTHFITEPRKDLRPCARRIGWYVMCNQVVLIWTAEKSLRLDTQRFALPMKGFECCVVLPRIFLRRDHCREPSTNKHVYHAMLPAALFFNGAVTLSIPGSGSSSCRRLPTSMSAQNCGPQGRSALDSHSAYPRRRNQLQTMTDQCGVFADHNKASALFRKYKPTVLLSSWCSPSLQYLRSLLSLFPSLPPTSIHQPQPFSLPLPQTLQSSPI